ncbi:MAG: phosphatidylglycerophosphatase A [Phycisphaerales bacterium]|nr:phosphatidylglycerophosphatase A [Phycisphaerales bacterium]
MVDTNAGVDSKSTERSFSDKLFLFIGSLAYLGFVPVASGTVSVAVAGVPLYLLLTLVLDLTVSAYITVVVAFSLFSIWIADRADRVLGEKDSSRNVIDELPGYLIALIGLPVTWQLIAAAFFIERAIDIVKVWPASWIERRLPGGWGVVLDDVVAGLYTLAILHLGVYWAPAWFGVKVAEAV